MVTEAPELHRTRARDGTEIAYAATGDGPALVHLPGVPLSDLEAEWRIPVLRGAYEGLATRLRLVQFDGRGTGHSQRAVDDVGLDRMLDDLDAVVTACGLRRFALLGFYLSVPVALAYAARRPERVTHLITFGAGARPIESKAKASTQALLSLIDRDWDTFVESATHAWLGWPPDDEGQRAADWFRTATSPATARAIMDAADRIDVSADLPNIRCPVLVLHRKDARVVPLAVSEALVAALHDARLRVLTGSSASLFFEGTDRVVADIIEFVSGAPAPQSAPSPQLSRRESEVLRWLAEGDTNGEIGRRLGIAEHTVERHVASIYRKLGVRGRADAIAHVLRARD